MKALVTGATGFVGRRLLKSLDRPTILTRDPTRSRGLSRDVEAHAWEPVREPPPAAAFEGVDTVFHLAGEPVAGGRWTAARKRRIEESRTIGTRHLVKTIETLATPPRVLVSASAIGYYGSRGDELLDESSSPAKGFLGDVCRKWEEEALKAEALGVRVVRIRVGVVLGPGGGALQKMLPPFKLGLGGRLGSGRQWMSWIHRDDLVAMMLFAAQNDDVSGVLNGVSPEPCTNRDFTAALARRLRRPALFPAPAFALKLALGELADMLLGSQRVVPKAASEAGFVFRFGSLEAALADVVNPSASRRTHDDS